MDSLGSLLEKPALDHTFASFMLAKAAGQAYLMVYLMCAQQQLK